MGLWKKIMKRFEYIAIDLDGTLIDSLDYLYKVYKKFLNEFQIKGSKNEFNELNGPKVKEIVSILKKRYEIKESNSNLLKNYNKRLEDVYKNKIILKDGIKEFLEYLKKNKYKIGLVTSASRKNVKLSLKKNKIQKYFSIIICGDDVKQTKPNPEIYNLFLKKANISKDKILTIEDSKNGYHSAKTAGLECMRIRRRNNVLKEFLKIESIPCEIISDSKKIILEITPFDKKISKIQKEKMEEEWKKIQKKRKKKMENNKVLILKSIHKNKKEILVKTSFVDYKYIITSRNNSSINLKLEQIGVSGLILINERGVTYTLFAKRSNYNTEYPNYFELVPSGNIDILSKQNKKNIDFKAKLLDELEEETGIVKEHVKRITELCIIEDKNNSVYDICCIIKLQLSMRKILKRFKRTEEYVKPQFVRIDDVSKFLLENKSRITPTTLGLVKLYFN
jgi:HAD superfamily hydrolase (TIGR01509 family)